MEAAHLEARLPMPSALLAPGLGKRIKRLVPRQAEHVVAALLAQQIEHLRRAVVAVAAHENTHLGPVPADAMDDVGEHARDLLARWPLARSQERQDRLARSRLEDVDRLDKPI